MRRQVTRHQASDHGQADGATTRVALAAGDRRGRWWWLHVPVRLVRALGEGQTGYRRQMRTIGRGDKGAMRCMGGDQLHHALVASLTTGPARRSAGEGSSVNGHRLPS